MAGIEWSEELSTCIPEIDEQHQTLVDMINTLDEAIAEGHGLEVVERLLLGLRHYAKTYFATEERLFDEHGYPDAVQHEEQHARFFQQIDEIDQELLRGSEAQLLELLGFMVRWLFGHMKGTDQEYVEFLLLHGA